MPLEIGACFQSGVKVLGTPLSSMPESLVSTVFQPVQVKTTRFPLSVGEDRGSGFCMAQESKIMRRQAFKMRQWQVDPSCVTIAPCFTIPFCHSGQAPLLSQLPSTPVDCRMRNFSRVDHVCPSEMTGKCRKFVTAHCNQHCF